MRLSTVTYGFALISLFEAAALGTPRIADIPPAPPTIQVRTLKADDFDHATGKKGFRGWELDYKRDRPGYVLTGLREPLPLENGLYRATFTLRRGHYPNRGLLHHTYGLFRLEIVDTTTNERVVEREVQVNDFSHPNQYEERWIDFSMDRIAGHVVEPRLYWLGLANGEVESVTIERFPGISLKTVEEKAARLGDVMENKFLENGFVVSRRPDGTPDDVGDATTYTGFYVASLAWKYAVTKDATSYHALESGLAALHNAIKGDINRPLLTRFVDAEDAPFPDAPSKDVYTSFFLAYAAAYPHVHDDALRKQMRRDLERLTNRFLKDNLTLRAGRVPMVSLTPYLTADEIADGIHKLTSNKKDLHTFVKQIKTVRRYFSFGELWPGMNELVSALERADEKRLLQLVVPTLNGLAQILERGSDILKEQYREDLFPRRFYNHDYPGKKLGDLAADALKRFPKNRDGQRFHQISDLRVLASNALISLHLVRTAQILTGRPQFEDYYRANLYTQDALLKTALDWYGIEEDFIRLTSGNESADRERRGYLGLLALENLISLEKNPFVKEKYRKILDGAWKANRFDDNPLYEAIYLACAKDPKDDAALLVRDLDWYPEKRRGFGEAYWKENGAAVAKKTGGGMNDGYSREPLPMSHRPKDPFLCQRNARRLDGDDEIDYPPTDFLFVYWYSRYHKLIPDPATEPVASVDNSGATR